MPFFLSTEWDGKSWKSASYYYSFFTVCFDISLTSIIIIETKDLNRKARAVVFYDQASRKVVLSFHLSAFGIPITPCNSISPFFFLSLFCFTLTWTKIWPLQKKPCNNTELHVTDCASLLMLAPKKTSLTLLTLLYSAISTQKRFYIIDIVWLLIRLEPIPSNYCYYNTAWTCVVRKIPFSHPRLLPSQTCYSFKIGWLSGFYF